MKLKTVSRIGSVLFAVIATCSLASAQLPFKGVIQMGPSAGGPASGVGIIFGDSTGNVTTNLGSAVTIEAWVGSVVEAVSGDFPAGLVGGAVTFTNGWTIGAPQNDLWRINSPLGNFSFDLLQANAIVFPDSDDFLRIEGTGILNGPPGYSPTPGNWVFTTQGKGSPYFSWSSSTSVPDGGTTVALLGFSLLGLHGLRRKLAKP